MIGGNKLFCGQKPFTVGDVNLMWRVYRKHRGPENTQRRLYTRGVDTMIIKMARSLGIGRPFGAHRCTTKRSRVGPAGFIGTDVSA